MALYFLALAATRFHDRLKPALAASWRQRSFTPARGACRELLADVARYHDQYMIGDVEPLIASVARGRLPYDRAAWRGLVGEVLLYAAADLPELQTAPETLRCLLVPGLVDESAVRRHPIWQAHFGTRELSFGGGFYRPDAAGLHDRGDVTRIARYLREVDPETWSPADLAALPDLDDEGRADELAFARQCFQSLADWYTQAEREGWVVVCESV